MNNIYVMSDVHGEYERFIKMLNKIEFTKNDKLYILGDVIDRGPDSIKLIKYIMGEKNIKLLNGNHESMMVESILSKSHLESGNIEIKESVLIYLDWLRNGGDITLAKFRKEPIKMQENIINYLSNLKEYEIIEANNQKYLLIHAGLFIPEGKKVPKEIDLNLLLDANIKQQLHLYIREDFLDAKEHITDIKIIFGHTPTNYIPEYTGHITKPMTKANLKRCESFKIYKTKYKIGIDCGCASKNGRLGCLRLNDMKEFYIK